MDAVSTLTDAIPLLIVTILGGWLLTGRLNRLETKIDARPTRDEMIGRHNDLRNEMAGRLDDLRSDINGRLTRLEAEVGALRSDVTQIAIALGARTRPDTA